MFNQIGPLELVVVLVIVLLIFGPKRLPGIGKQLGTGMREFKDSITGKGRDSDDDEKEPPAKTQATLTRAQDDEALASRVEGEPERVSEPQR